MQIESFYKSSLIEEKKEKEKKRKMAVSLAYTSDNEEITGGCSII